MNHEDVSFLSFLFQRDFWFLGLAFGAGRGVRHFWDIWSGDMVELAVILGLRFCFFSPNLCVSCVKRPMK